ncbi:MAG TPA: DUF1499 domain-containing protein [Allosphingosinicella sp.]|nr:DUF1499 domain-containing protein [Allosphingosinicella sp.]
MAQAMKRDTNWTRWITIAALLFGLGGATAALIAALGAGQEMWSFRPAFAVLRYAFFAAIAGAVLGVVGLIVARRAGKAKLMLANLVALVAALGFVLFLGAQIRTARSVPAIHDVATDLDDLPQFAALAVREDNLEKVPDMDRPELAAMAPEARWKAIHREAYGDLRTIRVPMSPTDTVRRAAALARERGWAIAREGLEGGALEATDTTFFFRFKDDVVLRARPAPGGGSLVDMRSISRVGGSDVGVNAARVRAFLKDLQAAG